MSEIPAKSSCSICGKPKYKMGYCGAHYRRLRVYGDPLGGGTYQGEPLRFILEVALKHTGEECVIWPFSTSRGYGRVYIDGKTVTASRYVCELAHGAPPTDEHDAAHSCGNGHLGCIAANHLDWKTKSQNQADRFVHGTHDRGERNARAKLADDEAREILALKGIKTRRELAERFGVSQQTVGKIHNGQSWAWLSEGIAA